MDDDCPGMVIVLDIVIIKGRAVVIGRRMCKDLDIKEQHKMFLKLMQKDA